MVRLDARPKWIAAVLTVCSIGLSSYSDARQFENRNFETGDLSGWSAPVSSDGSVFAQAVDASAGLKALQGQYSALLMTRSMWDISVNPCTGNYYDPWQHDCPIPIPFLSATNATSPPRYQPSCNINGCISLSQQLVLRAGDVVSFEFASYTNEPAGALGNLGPDIFFATLQTASFVGSTKHASVVCTAFDDVCGAWVGFGQEEGTPVDFYPAPAPELGPSPGLVSSFAFAGPAGTMQLTVPFDGAWTLSFTIFPADGEISSGVLLDNIRVARPHDKQ
jgi:hypothetical protein